VEGGWRRIGLPRLPAERTEEQEPDADDQDRKGEEADDTGIGAQFRSQPQCELAAEAGIAQDHENYLSTQPPLYCREYYNQNRNTLLN
jgi:hypothetical protein